MKYAIQFKSNEMKDSVWIECGDYHLINPNDTDQVLTLFNVSKVIYAQHDVTEICRIKDGIMTLENIRDATTRIEFSETIKLVLQK